MESSLGPSHLSAKALVSKDACNRNYREAGLAPACCISKGGRAGGLLPLSSGGACRVPQPGR